MTHAASESSSDFDVVNGEDPLLWLLGQGRFENDPAELIQGLCEKLLVSGVPLGAATCHFPTLHPQIAGCAFEWTPKGGASETCLPHLPVVSDSIAADSDRSIVCADHNHPPTLNGVGQRRSGGDRLEIPIAFSDRSTHLLTFESNEDTYFSTEHAGILRRVAMGMAPVLEVLMSRRVARSLLDTYVGERAGRRILHGQIQRGDVDRISAATWFSDLRNSTALAEALSPEPLLETLNFYFEHVAEAVRNHDGELLRFVGDGILAIFPAEISGELDSACTRALAAAVGAVDRLPALNAERTSDGHPQISFGIGLHVGEVLYGNVGAADRLDFTVTGGAVNRAARLQALTRDMNVPILMSGEFAALAGRPTQCVGLQKLKGMAESTSIHRLCQH